MPRPPRPWFRFYSEATESDKLDDLPDRLVKPWLRLLCLANVSTPRGSLPRIGKVRIALRVNEAKAQAIIEELVNHGFIDEEDGSYVMHDWQDWQYDSDANLTPGRANKNDVARSKERGKNAESPRKEHDTRSKRGAEAESEKEAETDIEGEREAESRAPTFPFTSAYARKHRERTQADVDGARQGRALSLEKEYGSELCFQVAEEKGWDKHPNYYVECLKERKNGYGDREDRGKSTAGANTHAMATGASVMDRRSAFVASQRRSSDGPG